MDKEKQIEEMAIVIDEYTEPLSARDIHKADFSERLAEALYDEGFGKQSVGEWIRKQSVYYCSNCGKGFAIRYGERPAKSYNFCPNCGARTKGGAE